MKTCLFSAAVCLFCIPFLFGQNNGYKAHVHRADSLFRAGQYRASADAFTDAFSTLGGKAEPEDRYTAAQAWALANVPDSAFYHLGRLLDKTELLSDEAMLTAQANFDALHQDIRWDRLLTRQRLKNEQLAAIRSKPLVIELESIHDSDQWYRTRRDSVIAVHGRNSPEYAEFRQKSIRQDSLNTVRISALLDSLGWLGADEVGDKANRAFFLVIQHADLPVQEKYLPMMRQAVADGKANASNLAYLEDRVLMRHGRPQRYGSQIVRDQETGAWILYEVEDPASLDQRRASVGLGPISEYLDMTGAIWKK
ncbi:MAG TPA: hypothetical protein PKH43_00255 [Saprospiraceae bacterium]|nr:hypothetical protein [Saprospiraceae bacterium]